jgi:L-glyceraldehyde 3-phosphate reductase
MGAVAQAVRTGKALYAGLSNYKAEDTRQAMRMLREMGAPCLIHQPRYSMFDRWVEGGLLETLAEEGAGCIAFSPLAQGLLTEKYLHGIPEGSRASKPHGFLRPAQVTPEKVAQVSRLNALAVARGQTLAQLALAWVLRHPQMTSVLIGASSVAQIEENVKTLENVSLSAGELRAIEAILAPAI